MSARFTPRSWSRALEIAALALAVMAPAARGQGEASGVELFFPDAAHDPAVPTPQALLGFAVGDRAATPAEIVRCLGAWAEASPRATLFEYGRTWEGRPLVVLAITSPANLARLEEIRAGWADLADPRGDDPAATDRRAAELPAVAWLAYSIHGDETSGADAALAVAYHLAAATDPAVEALLSELVVIVDPMMNPDGRDRFLGQVAEHRGGQANVDDQSLLHTGYWPWGRGNHYLADLNRDWIFGVHPETRGRLAAVGAWNPLLFVDAHEMGPQESYLFYPPTEPINPWLPEHVVRWWEVFGTDQARAFDRHGWRYYTGEWSEYWYPGYSDAWTAYRGGVAILYEQAGIAEDAVLKPGGTLATYRGAVHHQVVSSLANLETLRAHRVAIAADFLAARRRAVAADGPFAGRTFALLPSAHRSRRDRLVELLRLQGIEVHRLPVARTVSRATDLFGREHAAAELPADTLLVPNRQPEANLLAAMLDFDQRMEPEFLARERREIVRTGDSPLYDVSGWSLPMLHGLEALALASGLPSGAEPLAAGPAPSPLAGAAADAAVALVVDGRDDASVAWAARLAEGGVEVRVADRAFALDGHEFARGSLVVARDDNRASWDAAVEAAGATAAAVGVSAVGVTTGLAPGADPDLGGGHFPRLEPPRIALVGRGWTSTTDYGAIWLLLDRILGIRHTHLDEAALSGADLARYNVLVLPDRWDALPEGLAADLVTWVEAGGTLIAVAASARDLAAEAPGLSAVRRLPDVLGDLAPYRVALAREWEAASGGLDPEAVWARQPPAELDVPWPVIEDPDAEELARRDAWQAQFMPAGAIVAGRADGEHWLTFGAGDWLPLLVGDVPILMAGEGVEAPVRYGRLAARPGGGGATALGWGFLPAGHDLDLRLSGLLWPEAAQRLANAAYLTREARGRGQVILFADSPFFRAATWGSARLLANALVYGPGLGARHPIVP